MQGLHRIVSVFGRKTLGIRQSGAALLCVLFDVHIPSILSIKSLLCLYCTAVL